MVVVGKTLESELSESRSGAPYACICQCKMPQLEVIRRTSRVFVFITIGLTGHILATHSERRSRTLLSSACFDIYIEDGEIFYAKRQPPPARVR